MAEAAVRFLASLPAGQGTASQQEVNRFVRWYGARRPFAGLTAPQVAAYAERLSSSDTGSASKASVVRAFLAFARKQGWSQTNLATHLKMRKGKAGVKPRVRGGSAETTSLTPQRYAELEAELDTLKERRVGVIQEMSRAAADKDFRENAPLQAAREQYGHLAGRLREIEDTLKSAQIIDNSGTGLAVKVTVGGSVVLCDLGSGEEWRCMIVSPSEVDPGRGKISSASPIGRAVLGRREGDVVEVQVPAGKLRCQIKRIER
ncbi:MAG: transcription elongation factor GreA [Chloroflexota bacterium]